MQTFGFCLQRTFRRNFPIHLVTLSKFRSYQTLYSMNWIYCSNSVVSIRVNNAYYLILQLFDLYSFVFVMSLPFIVLNQKNWIPLIDGWLALVSLVQMVEMLLKKLMRSWRNTTLANEQCIYLLTNSFDGAFVEMSTCRFSASKSVYNDESSMMIG